MDAIKTLAVAFILGYLAVAAVLFLFQRNLQYLPDTRRVLPSAVGLAEAEEINLETRDGERLVAWYAPASAGQPTVVYFQGNGGALWNRADRFELFRKHGWGVLFLSYRGYGGSSGSPSEQGLLTDAATAIDYLMKNGVEPRELVYFGESLGSGVAVRAAVDRPPAAVVLEAPFTSAADVAARVYWWLPVRLLLKDQYDSLAVIDRVHAPLAIIHGERDDIVPIDLGRRLLAAANEPKKLIVLDGLGHNASLNPSVWREIVDFLQRAGAVR